VQRKRICQWRRKRALQSPLRGLSKACPHPHLEGPARKGLLEFGPRRGHMLVPIIFAMVIRYVVKKNTLPSYEHNPSTFHIGFRTSTVNK